MHVTIRQLTAVTALMTIGTAQAVGVVVPVGSAFNGISFYGASSLTFSADLLAALDTGTVSVAGYGAAVPVITKDTDGYYSQVTVTAPIASLTIDSTNGNVLCALTSGVATQTSPALNIASSGGSLTVTV